MAGRGGAVAVAVLALLAAGCSGGGHRARGSRRSAPGDALTFRDVLASVPYASRQPVGGAPFACDGGRGVTPAAKQAAAARIVLADRTRHLCYELGPTLLTGHDVDRADVVFNDSWAVTVSFRTDAFVRDVASVEVNRDVAIVLDGVVLSAPRVNPGITGRSITIAVGLDEATARHIAAALDPSSASRTPPTPTTTIVDTFRPRCDALGRRLRLGTATLVSRVDAATARTALARNDHSVPRWLARLDGRTALALCSYAAAAAGTAATTTTICPNGRPAAIGLTVSKPAYIVDARGATARLPGGTDDLLPPDAASLLCALPGGP